VAGHRLIDASVATLARALPADVADELADGLTETYERHRGQGLEPDAAAAAAIVEFGDPRLVIAAFVRQSPGRRAARLLLAAGPPVGGSWAAVLIAGHAWTWPIPMVVRLAFGATLLAIVVGLAIAATARQSYRRTRLAATACLGLLAVDSAVVACAVLTSTTHTGWLAVAITASFIRAVLTLRALPRLLAG
jgi:hypothetical protein